MKRSKQLGLSMIEILVTISVVSVGLLGLARFMAHTTSLSADSQEQARANVQLQDMSSRISNQRTADWKTLIANTSSFGSSISDCSSSVGAALQGCQWNNGLAGGYQTTSSANASAIKYAGCLTSLETDGRGNPTSILVSVAWSSPTPAMAAPSDTCGSDVVTTTANDNRRRVISTIVRLPVLSSTGLGTVAETP